MLRLLVIIYKYCWNDNIFHLVADIAFKNKQKAQKIHLMQFFTEKELSSAWWVRPLLDAGLSCRASGKAMSQELCVWRAATHSHISSNPSGPPSPMSVLWGWQAGCVFTIQVKWYRKPPALGDDHGMQICFGCQTGHFSHSLMQCCVMAEHSVRDIRCKDTVPGWELLRGILGTCCLSLLSPLPKASVVGSSWRPCTGLSC